MGDCEKTEGFKFAIVMLATLVGFLHTVFDYFQNSSIDENLYHFITQQISFGMTISIFLIIYIISNGFSLEMIQSSKIKKRIDNFSSIIYLATIIAYLWFLVLGITIYMFEFEINTYPLLEKIIGLILFIILLIFTLYVVQENDLIKDVTVYILFIGIIIGIFLFAPVSNSFQGNILIDMDNIYLKNDSIIPVNIKVTGLDSGLSIYLSKEKLNNNLTYIDSINYLESSHNSNKISLSEKSFISANALKNGNYNVFINTTNFSHGYYELTVECYNSDKVDIKSFYLLNR